jgi:hypothetical protein
MNGSKRLRLFKHRKINKKGIKVIKPLEITVKETRIT